MRLLTVKRLRRAHAVAIENLLSAGTPDVEYTGGWIELKYLRAWPKKETTFVKVERFTRHQRLFHYERRRAGGTSWVLIQCKREWILLDGATAALYLGLLTRSELYASAAFVSPNGLGEDLIQCILRKPNDYFWTEEDEEKLKRVLRSA